MRVSVEEPVVEHLGHVALAHPSGQSVHGTTANEVDFTQELGNLVRFHGELANEEGVTSPVAYQEGGPVHLGDGGGP